MTILKRHLIFLEKKSNKAEYCNRCGSEEHLNQGPRDESEKIMLQQFGEKREKQGGRKGNESEAVSDEQQNLEGEGLEGFYLTRKSMEQDQSKARCRSSMQRKLLILKRYWERVGGSNAAASASLRPVKRLKTLPIS